MSRIPVDKVHETLKKYILADGYPVVYDIANSAGSLFCDALSKKKYIDFFSFFASMPLGHNHPGLKTDEAKNALMEVAFAKLSNSDIYTQAMAEFVDCFSKNLTSDYFPYHFFISGGGLAVENALKVAFDWKVRKNGDHSEHDVSDLEIIHFNEAFHGRTGYTISLTNTSDPRKFQHFPKFPWPRILNPKVRFPLNDENLHDVKKREEESLAAIKAVFNEKRAKIAGIIIEPIQGEGGDNHFRPEFLQALRQLANENEALLIFDEVQTGMGLTGKRWCFENYEVVPDIISFGKKTQVCGIACSKRLDEVEGHVFQTSSRINSTWGGNLIDMVRCRLMIEIIMKEGLIENTITEGAYLLSKLDEIALESKTITNVRGKGLFIAFDLPSTEHRNKFLAHLFDHGLMALASGDESIRFRPFLDLDRETTDNALGILKDSLATFRS